MSASTKAVVCLCIFFMLVFTMAYRLNPHNPVSILAGESSAGTWMSGALLTTCAVLSMVIAMRKGWWPWALVSAFFIVLAIDERFMFHEQLKERIVFWIYHNTRWFTAGWIFELPVIVGAIAGGWVAFVLWRHIHTSHRIPLVAVALLGTASVMIDILRAGVVWEEGFKLLAELTMACVLIREVEMQ